MNSTSAGLQVRNSEFKGLRVLVVDPNEERGAAYEAKADLDKDLQRIEVFVVSSMREARNQIKSRRPNIAVFPGELDGLDFVTLQIEFRNANASTGLVPMIETPTLQQYRESRSVGGVIDFAHPNMLDTYESFRDFVIQISRLVATKQPGLEEGLNYALGLQRALVINSPRFAKIKSTSAILCREMAAWYDLGSEEAVKLILAEKLFFPDLTKTSYEDLLGDDPYGLLDALSQTASWTQTNSRPSSASGLIITAANCISHWREDQVSQEEISEKLKARPAFLMHVSLRVITAERIGSLLAQLDNLLSESALG